MNNWESLLASFDEQWESIDVDPSGNVRLPDGIYQVLLDSTLIDESKEGGKVLWKITFKVLTGQHAGRLIFYTNVLNDPDRLQYVKQDCYRLGFPIARLSDLPRQFEQMLDLKVEVRLKTNGEYQNCYIQKRLDDVDGGALQQQPNRGGRGQGAPRTGGNRNGRPAPPNVSKSADPFADDGRPIDISDDDLPF